jgi:hypothetical protein
MKIRLLFTSLLVTVGMFLAATTITAADRAAVSPDISRLNAQVSRISEDAKLPQGEGVVAKQLANDFKVSSDRINLVLGSMMQYGDVAATLAFAEKMPGGITDQNVNKVMNTRSRGAWTDVAQQFGIDPTTVAGRLSSVQDNIQTALAVSYDQGRAAGGVDPTAGRTDVETEYR